MTLKTLAAAACMSICTATAGLAATVTVTVDGIGYDVTTITGTFADNEALLMDQVWWEDSDKAFDFAIAVDDRLGVPNLLASSPAGPIFAFRVHSLLGFPRGRFLFHPLGSDTHWADFSTYTYAIATPVSAVPLPAGGLLLVSAFGGIAALTRRKKGSA